MRGRIDSQGTLFFAVTLESLIPKDHPLRAIKKKVDGELKSHSAAFTAAYSGTGRPSIPPEQLLKAMVLQALYSIRSENQLCEQIAYNFLYRWFLDMKPEDPVFDRTEFVHNRQRFHESGLVEKFFAGSVFASVQQEAASREHFSVDGTLIQAWASMKSVRPKSEKKDSDDSNSWHDFHGQNRSNETHESKTDPEAKLARKSDGKETKLSHSMHVLMENRHGFLMDVKIAEANGTAERIEALGMTNKLIQRFGRRRRTLGADKGYDDGTFLWQMEHLEITPHVAIRDGEIKNKSWPGRLRSKCRNLAQYGSYQMSQKRRRCSEALIGWLKKVAGLERTRFVGRWKTQIYAYVAGATLNYLKLINLEVAKTV